MNRIDKVVKALPSNIAVTDPDIIAKYLTDFRNLLTGSSKAVLRPRTTEHVQLIVTECHKYGVPLVPQGGNTSYCTAATPSADGSELLVSLEGLNTIREMDSANLSITAEAGVVLSTLQKRASDAGFQLPLGLGSQQSCQIGGNLSTNAGGISVVKYGMARDLVLGLEVVLPDGRLLNVLSPLRKNNTGYDVKQMFIGAEGTLGIITAASLKLARKPVQTVTALLAVAEITKILDIFARAQTFSGENITSFEYISDSALQMLLDARADLRHPLSVSCPHYVLLETATCSPVLNLEDATVRLFETLLNEGLVLDGALATSGQMRDNLWVLRETIPEAEVHNGGSVKHDVSVATSRLPEFIQEASSIVHERGKGGRLSIYGHVGDGNVHFNVVAPSRANAPEYKLWFEELVSPLIYDLAAAMGGSFSAEYGIGRVKLALMQRYGDPTKLEVMQSVKLAIDPLNIMNPGKVVPFAEGASST